MQGCGWEENSKEQESKVTQVKFCLDFGFNLKQSCGLRKIMRNPKVITQNILGTQQLSSHEISKFFQLLIIPKRTYVFSEILPRKIVGKYMKIRKTNRNFDLESYLLVTGSV